MVANAPMKYADHGAIRKVWHCRDPEILCDGPAGTGKTRGILEKGYLAAMKYPGARVLLTRKTRSAMSETVLVTFERDVLPTDSPLKQQVMRRNRQSYELPNGSELVVCGMDTPERVMSGEYDLILVFEGTEMTENDHELLTTRLRNGKMPYQQIIVDCNPSAPTHWLKRRADAGKMTRFASSHKDNPRLWNGEDWTDEGKRYLSKLDALSGHRLARLRDGRWAAATGLVYPGFGAAHLIERFEVPPSWPRYRSIDFGYTNPFSCSWYATDPDGRLYLYRQIYHTRRTVKVHAEQIKELSKGETFYATISDHDAEDRATLDENGIGTVPANKAVTVGIEKVTERLKIRGDGKPGLFVMRGALVELDTELDGAKRPTCTEQEFDAYVYPPTIEGKSEKEEPVKANDHGLDELRYMVMHLDAGALSVVEWADAPVPKAVRETDPVKVAVSVSDDFELRRQDPDWGFDE